MTDGLLRQRRNLFIISVVIIFLRLGGVKIDKVALLGTELSFENIEALYAAIWVAFAYFLIRYYQYFRQEPDRGVANEFLEKLDSLCYQRLREESIRQHPASEKYGGEFQLSKLKKVGICRREGTVVTRQNGYGKQVFEPYAVDVHRYILQVLNAAFHVVVHRSGITDYYLPFILALSALLYGFSGEWQGSLLNVLAHLVT